MYLYHYRLNPNKCRQRHDGIEPVLRSDHLHGKNIGDKENSTGGGSHLSQIHHQSHQFCRYMMIIVFNFFDTWWSSSSGSPPSWGEQKPSSWEPGQRELQTRPSRGFQIQCTKYLFVCNELFFALLARWSKQRMKAFVRTCLRASQRYKNQASPGRWHLWCCWCWHKHRKL